MENNSTKTVAKPTPDELLRIFMQYPGQEIESRATKQKWEIHGLVNCRDGAFAVEFSSGYSRAPVHEMVAGDRWTVPIANVSILLKPLESISDEDAKQILKYMNAYPTFSANFTEEEKSKTILSVAKGILHATSLIYLPAIIIDFLRSRGYALPYMQCSVDELVSAGIYKLETV